MNDKNDELEFYKSVLPETIINNLKPDQIRNGQELYRKLSKQDGNSPNLNEQMKLLMYSAHTGKLRGPLTMSPSGYPAFPVGLTAEQVAHSDVRERLKQKMKKRLIKDGIGVKPDDKEDLKDWYPGFNINKIANLSNPTYMTAYQQVLGITPTPTPNTEEKLPIEEEPVSKIQEKETISPNKEPIPKQESPKPEVKIKEKKAISPYKEVIQKEEPPKPEVKTKEKEVISHSKEPIQKQEPPKADVKTKQEMSRYRESLLKKEPDTIAITRYNEPIPKRLQEKEPINRTREPRHSPRPHKKGRGSRKSKLDELKPILTPVREESDSDEPKTSLEQKQPEPEDSKRGLEKVQELLLGEETKYDVRKQSLAVAEEQERIKQLEEQEKYVPESEKQDKIEETSYERTKRLLLQELRPTLSDDEENVPKRLGGREPTVRKLKKPNVNQHDHEGKIIQRLSLDEESNEDEWHKAIDRMSIYSDESKSMKSKAYCGVNSTTSRIPCYCNKKIPFKPITTTQTQVNEDSKKKEVQENPNANQNGPESKIPRPIKKRE